MKTILSSILLLSLFVSPAGAQTKDSPYTVAQLLSQKDALAASGETVWVKADLKGLGEDGSSTSNADTEDGDGKTVKHMAGLFGDDTGDFVAYSWQILGQLDIADLTNTKDLLIALTYGTEGHPYGNTAYPQYASNEEPTEAHFSLAEVHGALTLNIPTGLRGYHITSAYQVPADVIAIKVSAGYSSKNGAYVNYTNFDGTNEGNLTHVTSKNLPMVLMAAPGKHHFVLSAGLNEQTMSNGNALVAGQQAGVNTGTKNRVFFRFITGDKTGFQRNSSNDSEVILGSKDEVFLSVSSLETNFMGKYEFETATKDWISWKGGQYSDFHDMSGINNLTPSPSRGGEGSVYTLQGTRVQQPAKGLYIINGKKVALP